MGKNSRAMDLILILLPISIITALSVITKNFWTDELWSINATGQSLASTLDAVSRDVHPPLYFLLLHAWTLAFGNSEVSLRVFQGIQGAVLLYSALILFRRILPSARYSKYWLLILISSEFWLLMPMLRYYTLAAILGTLATYFLLSWISGRTNKSLFILGTLYIMLLYTSYTASFIIGVHFIYLLVFHRAALTGHLKPLVVASVAFIPQALTVLEQATRLGSSGQVADLNSMAGVSILKMGYSMYAYIFGEMIFPLSPIVLVIAPLLAFIVLFKVSWRSMPGGDREQAILLGSIVLLGLLFTSLLTSTVSRHTSFIYTPARNFYALPFIFLALGILERHINSATLRRMLIVSLVAVNLYGGFNWAMNRQFMNPVYASPWKQVLSEIQGEKGIIFSDEDYCYTYYVNQDPAGDYPRLIVLESLDMLEDPVFKQAVMESEKVFVIRHGRDSSTRLSAAPVELMDFLSSNRKLSSHKKYLVLEDRYKRLKEKMLKRESYDAKFNLYAFE